MNEVCNTFWFMNPMSLEAKTPLFLVASDSINTPYPSDFHLCIFCNLVLLHRPRRHAYVSATVGTSSVVSGNSSTGVAAAATLAASAAAYGLRIWCEFIFHLMRQRILDIATDPTKSIRNKRLNFTGFINIRLLLILEKGLKVVC